MKVFKHSLLIFALVLGLSSLNSCNKCEETGEVTISDSLQYFTITYLDTAGNNYITSIFNLSNVNVLQADNFVNNPQYVPAAYTENFADGKLGPIPYSIMALNNGTLETNGAKIGVPYSSRFLIKRDTYGWDTLLVEFLATTDQCKEFWREITYTLNGDSLGTFQDQEIANLEIIIP